MADLPDYTTSQSRRRHDNGYEPHDISETGATLWIAVAVILVIIAGLSLFGHNEVRNGGAPFVITPSSDLTAAPNGGL